MNSEQYYKIRAEQNIKRAKKIENSFLKVQQENYSMQLAEINSKVKDIYLKAKEGRITNSDLYDFGRYDSLRKQIVSSCDKLNVKCNSDMFTSLSKLYRDTFKGTGILLLQK